MNYSHIMIHYGELSTKGKNKSSFIKILFDNIKHALKDYQGLSFEKRYDHIYIYFGNNDYEKIMSRLQDVSGIHSLSLVYRSKDKEIETIFNDAYAIINNEEGKTFKINVKRADKSFPIHSDELIRKVASNILKNSELKVDVHNPDILMKIDIREEAVYLYCKTILGAGGYPLGVGGKSMHMLSGGIDSPVSAYLMMKRGVKIECIHFASPPYTNIGVIYKLEDLLHKLNYYQASIRLNIIPFTKLQEAIYDHIPESYCITVMRRMMYRLATALAKKRKCLVISTGESVGQVASQTLSSINVINEVTTYPIIRPLATYDKLDIINIANKIDTFDISIRPYEDCCTIFTPKSPKTNPELERVKEYEATFDYQSLIDEALNNIEVKNIE